MSFIEISLATLVMALALLPIFGLITGGLVRSDVSVSYSSALEISSSIMSKLLSEQIPFGDIPASPEGTYKTPEGSVAGAASLDLVFDDPGWQVDENSRTLVKENILYRVELWVGEFREDGDLTFHYYENPRINYNQANPFNAYYATLRLRDGDWEFSPYNTESPHITGSAWATVATSLTQWDLSTSGTATPRDQNENLKKLVLRTSWGPPEGGTRAVGRAVKDIWLVSFRANLVSRQD